MTAEITHFYADTPIGATGEVLKVWSDGKRKWYKLYFGKNLSGQKLIKSFPEDVLKEKK